jgi:hypothetical protein
MKTFLTLFNKSKIFDTLSNIIFLIVITLLFFVSIHVFATQ